MKKLIFTLLAGVAVFTGKAQDIHFSQFYASPLTLNPGMTGISPGDFRIIANFRNQWTSVTDPFLTSSLSFDMKAYKFRGSKDFVGAGAVIVNDGSSVSTLRTLRFMASGAYHKALDFNGNHFLTVGLQVGLVQKGLGNNISFPNQWDEATGFDPNSGGEAQLRNNIGYGDFQTGLMYYGFLPDRKSSIFGGAAIFHLAKPNESFIPGYKERIHRRLVTHAGSRFALNDQWTVIPDVVLMFQSSAREINIGSSVSYKISASADESPNIKGGAWYRFGDAVILMGGVEIQNWIAGISYDINVSSLSEVSKYRGAFEFSLQYNLNRFGSRSTSPRI